MAIDFYIQIEDASGNKLGSGPITSATGWRSVARMDRAGEFSFAMPATDEKAGIVTKKRVVRAYALLDAGWTEIGAGVVDKIQRQPDQSGVVTLNVSGDDLVSELRGRSVHYLEINDTMAVALGQIDNYAGGWTFNADAAPPVSGVYARFAGDSALTALIKVAEATYTHFYYGGNRTLTFDHAWSDSGVRAIQATGALVAETCAIASLEVVEDSHDMLNWIVPLGAGQAVARLTILPTSRTAFQIDTYTYNGRTYNVFRVPGANPTGIIYLADSITENGLLQKYVEFKEIGPISNTDPDLQFAANCLFDAGIRYLDQHAQEQRFYNLSVVGCSKLLRPLQTIRVIYRDPDAGLSIDENLLILEVETSFDGEAIHTTRLTVSTIDRYPDSDLEETASEFAQGSIYRAYPQLNANSYVLPFSKNVDATESAVFRFRLGAEVVALQQVIFDLQILPLESTVKAVALQSMTGGSGELITSGATGNTTTPSNNTSGGPSVADTGAATGNTGAASGNTGAATGDTSGPSVANTGAATGATGAATGNTGAASGSTGAATGSTGGPSSNTSGGPSTNTSGGSGTLTTGGPQGGDTEVGGGHYHELNIIPVGDVSSYRQIYIDPVSEQLYTTGSGSAINPGTTIRGDHSHSTTGSHTHTLGSHSHDLGGHSHDLGSHSHGLGSHTHDLGSHTHGLGSHTHGLGSHTHNMNSHTHGLGSHTHTLGSHTHTLGDHTHSLNAHTHNLNNHQHTMTPTVQTQYGIFRDVAGNTWLYDELEYRVNSGAWLGLTLATALGDGWRRLDVTAALMNATSFRPLQEGNSIEVRASAGLAITRAYGTGSNIFISTSPAPVVSLIGQTIQVTGTVRYNGTFTVIDVYEGYIAVLSSVIGPDETAGYVKNLSKKATIDAQLSVRDTIQAIAYTS